MQPEDTEIEVDQSELTGSESRYQQMRRRLRRRFLGGTALMGVGLIASSVMRMDDVLEESRGFQDESDYREYLGNLGLRYLSPSEIIRPHRNVLEGVSNSLPPKRLWKNLRKSLLAADAIRKELGVPIRMINSAYRSPQYNAKCSGAAKKSYHLKNMALDVKFACSSTQAVEAARKLRANGVFKGGIGLYPSFIHIDSRGYNANWGQA